MGIKTLITLMTLACLLVIPARAQVNYVASGTTAYVTSSPNASGDIVILSTYKGYPVTSIGDYAFYTASLTSVTIGNSVTNIGNHAFAYCHDLRNVTIPNSVTSIEDYAFSDCHMLTSVAISDSVTLIPEGAFQNCTSLTNVTIPNSVTNIGNYAFSDCTNLTNLSVDAGNPTYSSLDGVLFDRMQTTLITFPTGRDGSYVIPNGVADIGDSAFSGCTRLTSVTIPNSITSIGGVRFSAAPA